MIHRVITRSDQSPRGQEVCGVRETRSESAPVTFRTPRVRPIDRSWVGSVSVKAATREPTGRIGNDQTARRAPALRWEDRCIPRTLTGIGLALTLLVPTLVGCQEPEERITIAQRDERMRTIIHDFYERERLSPENIRQLGELGEELERRHQEELRSTLQMAEDRLKSDFRDWQEMKPLSEKEFQNLFGAQPERIEENWSMMVE